MKSLWNYLSIYDKTLILSLIIISVFFIISPFSKLLIGGASDGADQLIVIQSANGSRDYIPLADTYRDQAIIVEAKGPLGISFIEAHNGRVRLKEAPPEDPEKICEKTGWISQPGPMIICVPNQISIWIEAKESDLDGVSW